MSGPVISTGNFPNLSWSVALLPWVLWATDRLAAAPDGRRLALAGLIFGCQALAGEPVTMAATAALAIGYAAIAAPPPAATWRRRGVLGALAVVAVLLGLLIGAVQLLPLQAAVTPGSAPMACRTPGPCTRWVCSKRWCRICSAIFFRRRSLTRCPGWRRSTAAASHFSSRSTWVPRCWASRCSER